MITASLELDHQPDQYVAPIFFLNSLPPSLFWLINILLQVILQTLDGISNSRDDCGEKRALEYFSW